MNQHLVVTITSVNAQRGIVHAVDQYRSTIVLALEGSVVPAEGEKWYVERRADGRYHLVQRFTDLRNLNPGDRQIDASGTLHLNASEILVNGEPLGSGGGGIAGISFADDTGIDFGLVTSVQLGTGNITVEGTVDDETGILTIRMYFPPAVCLPWFADTLLDRTMLANGAIKKRLIYPALFGKIGTLYNTGGEASDEFRLPSIVGRVPVGLDGSQTEFNALGKVGGAMTVAHVHTIAHTHTMQSHTHTMGSHTHTLVHTHNVGYTASFNVSAAAPVGWGQPSQNVSTDGPSTGTTSGPSTNSTGGPSNNTTSGSSAANSGSENVSTLQPFVTISYLITY